MATYTLKDFVNDELQQAATLGRTVVDSTLRTVSTLPTHTNAAERFQVVDLIMSMRQRGPDMAEAFSKALKQEVMKALGVQQAASERSALPKAIDIMSLSLLDEGSVNADVQISHCATTIKAIAEFELRELTTFTSTLAGDDEVHFEHNPFNSEVMARAMWGAAMVLPEMGELRNDFMRHGSPVLAATLRKAYAAACGRLEDLGVQPAVYRTMIVPAGAKIDRPGWTSTDQALRSIAKGMNEVNRPEEPGEEESTVWGQNWPGGTQTYEATQQAPLTAIPPAATAPIDLPTARPVVTAAATVPGPSPSATGSTAGQETAQGQYLTLLNRLFDIIMADRRMARDIKFTISRLQAPGMRLALTDPTLLDALDHPLWALIDRLAWQADILPEDGTPLRQQVMDALEQLVTAISASEAQSSAIYRSALAAVLDGEAQRFEATRQSFADTIARLDPSSRGSSKSTENMTTPVAPLDTGLYDTVPSALLDLPSTMGGMDKDSTWINKLQPGHHARIYIASHWVHAVLVWVSADRDTFLWADTRTPQGWPIRERALELLHNEGLAGAHRPRSLVRAAARMVAQQIARDRQA